MSIAGGPGPIEVEHGDHRGAPPSLDEGEASAVRRQPSARRGPDRRAPARAESDRAHTRRRLYDTGRARHRAASSRRETRLHGPLAVRHTAPRIDHERTKEVNDEHDNRHEQRSDGITQGNRLSAHRHRARRSIRAPLSRAHATAASGQLHVPARTSVQRCTAASPAGHPSSHPRETHQKGTTMFHSIHPEHQLDEIRERHERLRRHAEHSRTVPRGAADVTVSGFASDGPEPTVDPGTSGIHRCSGIR